MLLAATPRLEHGFNESSYPFWRIELSTSGFANKWVLAYRSLRDEVRGSVKTPKYESFGGRKSVSMIRRLDGHSAFWGGFWDGVSASSLVYSVSCAYPDTLGDVGSAWGKVGSYVTIGIEEVDAESKVANLKTKEEERVASGPPTAKAPTN